MKARKQKKMALYEVFSKTMAKSRHDTTLEKLHPTDSGQTSREEASAGLGGHVSERITRWPKSPKVLQFNAGRVELSLPYPLAIAVLLGIALLILVAFRLGEIVYEQKTNRDAAVPKESTDAEVRFSAGAPGATEVVTPAVDSVAGQKTKGNNRIVIQTWKSMAQLVPVRDFFTEQSISTEIRKIDNVYYLVTTKKYENPQRYGTDGYRAKQRIIGLGANYKAPPGYGSFGPKPFHDAYGMKFDD